MHQFIRTFACLIFALGLSGGIQAREFKAGSLVIENPWTRATPAGAKLGGGYLTITNNGSETDRLTGGAFLSVGRVEIHEMKMDADVMRMRALPDGLEVAPGSSVELKPGGYHVMFMDLKEPFKQGESVKGELRFDKAGAVSVEFKVESIGARGSVLSNEAKIADLLHKNFDKPNTTLRVSPIVVAGDYAIAGWTQGDMGGRALLRNKHQEWTLILCAGDAIKTKDSLLKVGVADDDAAWLERDLAAAEAKLDSKELAMFSRFEGLVMMDDARAKH